MKIEEVVGANLARLRGEVGMSQAELGQAVGAYLDKTWSRQAVSASEKGRRAFTSAELVALALILEVSIDFLLMPVDPKGMDDLLPGAKKVTAQDYEHAIVGATPEGDPTGQALVRARGILIAAYQEQVNLAKALAESAHRQLHLMDYASSALGLTERPAASAT